MSIYKITSTYTPDIYIGKTESSLATRMSQHKTNLRRYLSGKEKGCCEAKHILKYSDATISLVELVPDKANQKLRERYHIENTPNCINKAIPGQTQMEYYWNIENGYRERQHKCNLDYYHNKGGKEKQRIYNNIPENKERNLANHRLWTSKNKVTINAKKREDYPKYKEVINRKWCCPYCGKSCLRRSRFEHLRTLRCVGIRRKEYARRVIYNFVFKHHKKTNLHSRR